VVATNRHKQEPLRPMVLTTVHQYFLLSNLVDEVNVPQHHEKQLQHDQLNGLKAEALLHEAGHWDAF
jgi:hypothetical protein